MSNPIAAVAAQVAPWPTRTPAQVPLAGTPLARVQTLLDQARLDHRASNLPAAERGFRAVIETASSGGVSRFDERVIAARQNLAQMLKATNRDEEAAELLRPLLRTDDQLIYPDPEVHALYGELRFRQFDRMLEQAVPAPQKPTFANKQVTFQPPLLEPLREGARSALDLTAMLVTPGARAALSDTQLRQFMLIATTAQGRLDRAIEDITYRYRSGTPENDQMWNAWIARQRTEIRGVPPGAR